MRDVNDFSGVLREGCWIVGCVALATAFCYLAPEEGYSPVWFFSVCLYLLTGVARIVFAALLRRFGKSARDA